MTLVCRSCGLVFQASEAQAEILASAARMMGGEPGRDLMECDGCKGRRVISSLPMAPKLSEPAPTREPGADDGDEERGEEWWDR